MLSFAHGSLSSGLITEVIFLSSVCPPCLYGGELLSSLPFNTRLSPEGIVLKAVSTIPSGLATRKISRTPAGELDSISNSTARAMRIPTVRVSSVRLLVVAVQLPFCAGSVQRTAHRRPSVIPLPRPICKARTRQQWEPRAGGVPPVATVRIKGASDFTVKLWPRRGEVHASTLKMA